MKYALLAVVVIAIALASAGISYVCGEHAGYKRALADVNANRDLMFVLKKNKYGELVWVSNNNYNHHYNGDN